MQESQPHRQQGPQARRIWLGGVVGWGWVVGWGGVGVALKVWLWTGPMTVAEGGAFAAFSRQFAGCLRGSDRSRSRRRCANIAMALSKRLLIMHLCSCSLVVGKFSLKGSVGGLPAAPEAGAGATAEKDRDISPFRLVRVDHRDPLRRWQGRRRVHGRVRAKPRARFWWFFCARCAALHPLRPGPVPQR